jgi:glucokinase
MIDAGDGGGGLYLGIEIGGTKLQVVLGQDAGHIVERHRFPVEPARGGAALRAQLDRLIPDLPQRVPLAAVGVGFGGPVDWKTGRICCSHQIEGWSGFPLASWLSSLAHAPVFVDNDANLGALGEAVHGAAAGFNPVFYVTLGSGVGGGLVVDGKIYHGAPPGESEIGHIRLDRSGTLLESRCSGWAVDARIRAAAARNPDSVLARCVGTATAHEARFLSAALAQNDPLAAAILEETAQELAFGLSHVVHLVHPEIIVLGGGLSLLGEPLRAAVERLAPRFIMQAFAPGPRIALAKLAEDAVPVGALYLAAMRTDTHVAPASTPAI